MRAFAYVFASALMALTAAPVFGATETPGQSDATQFDRIDANGDGKISKEEFDKARDARYDAFDTNDDGVLSIPEVAVINKPWLQKERGASDLVPWVDNDGNGAMDQAEFAESAGQRFTALDADQDGALNSAEYESDADYWSTLVDRAMAEAGLVDVSGNQAQTSQAE